MEFSALRSRRRTVPYPIWTLLAICLRLAPSAFIRNEQSEDVRVVFTGGVAIVNFTKRWTDYDKKAGISWGGTSRMTRVLTCKNGGWKLVAWHETDIPNRNRKPVGNDHLDDHAGRYRLGADGDKGEISVVRKGETLSET